MSSIDVPPTNRITPVTSTTIKPTMTGIPIEALPESLGGKTQSQTVLQAEVKNYDPQRQILTLQTSAGDVSVKLPVPLKSGTSLQLEISTESGKPTATLILQKSDQATAAKPQTPTQTPNTNTPPTQNNAPPVKAGDVTSGLIIPNDKPVQTTSPPNTQTVSSPAQAAIVIEQLKLKDLASLPKPVVEMISKLLAAEDPVLQLLSLSPDKQAKLLQIAQQSITTPPITPETDDQALAAILGNRTPSAALQSASPSLTPVQNALGVLKALMPFLQAATENPAPTLGTSMPLTPQQQLSNQTYDIRIISILPPATTPTVPSSVMPAIAQISQDISTPALNAPAPAQSNDATAAQTLKPILGTTTSNVGPQQLTGIVDSITPEGTPVIKMADVFVMLRESGPLPLGSRVTFDIEPPAMQAIPIPVALALLDPSLPLPQMTRFEWPALNAAIQLLFASAPDIAQNIRSTIPDAGPKFASGALFFMAALKTADIANWIGGEALLALRNTARKGLAERLAEDFRTLSRQNTSTGGEWRSLSMPLLQDDQLSMAQLFLRYQPLPQENNKQANDQAEKNQDGPQKMTRFVLNLRLSRMGDIQLDGLLKAKNMDMILRTQDRLPPSMKQELLQAYARGMESAAMEGSLIFQTKSQNWIDIKENKPA